MENKYQYSGGMANQNKYQPRHTTGGNSFNPEYYAYNNGPLSHDGYN